MLGFVSNCLLYCFIYIDASFSECVFVLLYLEGGVGGELSTPMSLKSLYIQHLGSVHIAVKLKTFPSPNLDNE